MRRQANVTASLIVFLSLELAGVAWVPTRPAQNPTSAAPTPGPGTMPGSARCTELSTQADAPSDVRAIEAALYQAIVRLRMGDRRGPLIVESVSLPVPPLRVANDRGMMDALPADLKAPVRDGVPDCFELTADRFPAGTRLVPLAEIRQGAGRGRADWASVAARFDGAGMWFAFSRALLGGGRRDAVVFYERPCTGRCGEAEWVWFHRAQPNDAWQVMKEVWRWIS